MASRALGSMFGGLEKFLQLRRGLNQNTEDRDFLSKERDVKLRLGEGQVTGQNLDNTAMGTKNKYLEPNLQLDLAGKQKDVFGPEGVALRGIFGENADTRDFQKGLARQVSRNATTDAIQDSQKVIQGNAATGSTLRTNALQDVVANPGDPLNNPADYGRAVLAGVPEMGRAPQGVTQKWDVDNREDTQRHSTSMQAQANQFQIDAEMRNLPPGVDQPTHRMAISSIDQLAKTAAAAQAQLARIDAEIAENQSRINTSRVNNPKGSFDANGAAAAFIKQKDLEKAQQQKNVQEVANGIMNSLMGLNINDQRTLRYYQDLINSVTVGMKPAPKPPDGPPPPAISPSGGVKAF